jgi:hypothetical protein
MKRLFVTVSLLLFASITNASMVLLGAAISPSQMGDATANEKLLISALRTKDGSTVYLDKAWHGLHFLLTGTAYDANSILGQAILGGRPIGEDQGYGPMRVVSPEQVKDIAAALSKVTPEELSARYDPPALDKARIYPTTWVRDGPEGLKYLLSFFGPFQAFYKRAAENGQAVVLIIA